MKVYLNQQQLMIQPAATPASKPTELERTGNDTANVGEAILPTKKLKVQGEPNEVGKPVNSASAGGSADANDDDDNDYLDISIGDKDTSLIV